MSDAQPASHDPPAPAHLFEKSELAQFVADDQLAGQHICKLLASLFIYTLIAMSIAATWTYYATM
ncbi:MAG TPA: hypothetical protein VK137_20205 [Planctomycetaceae bacterium]|nr:hypothetical protein [Planctomycetaceae bacterium]